MLMSACSNFEVDAECPVSITSPHNLAAFFIGYQG
jgi:hypothetical protein